MCEEQLLQVNASLATAAWDPHLHLSATPGDELRTGLHGPIREFKSQLLFTYSMALHALLKVSVSRFLVSEKSALMSPLKILMGEL